MNQAVQTNQGPTPEAISAVMNADAIIADAQADAASVVPNTITDFDTALRLFKMSNKETQEYARLAADLAITHFKEEGQVAKLQLLHDALTDSFNKAHLSSFKLWAAAHSPLTMKDKKFLKDKGLKDANGMYVRRPIDFDLEAAYAKPFWEYKLVKEAEVLTRDEALKRIVKLAESFLDEGKWIIADPECLSVVQGFNKYANNQNKPVQPEVLADEAA